MTAEQPALLVFNYTEGILGVGGDRVTCPECGEGTLLVVQALATPDELVDDPAYVRCPWGHLWAEPTLPRRYVLGPILDVIAANPDAWQEVGRLAGEQGGRATIDVHDGEVR